MLKINKKTLAIAISAVVVAAGATSIQAAGFQLKEQSAEGQGNSFAGQTAKAVDASTIFYNPAGMSRLEGNHVQSNLSYIAPSAKYEHSSSSSILGASPLTKTTGVDGGVSAIVPAAYAVWDYSDDVKFGISVNAPYGLSTDFNEDWVGADYNVLSEIKTINLAPSISYKVNDKLSIGGNVQLQKIEGTLSSQTFYAAAGGVLSVKALTTLKAEDTGFGYSMGFLYEYSDKGRIGFNYRSEIKHNLEGNVSTPSVPSPALNFDASAKFTTPAAASIGIYQEVSDQWSVLADVSWTDWSVFDELQVVKTDGTVSSTTTYNWKDNIFVALGANYQHNDKVQLKFGVAYDQGAANDEDRTAGIPDATRYWASLGASYKMNKQTTLNAGYSYIKAQSADVTESFAVSGGKATSYSGTFKPTVHIVSVGMDYQF